MRSIDRAYASERRTHQRFIADLETPRTFVGRMAYIPNPARRPNLARRILRMIWRAL